MRTHTCSYLLYGAPLGAVQREKKKKERGSDVTDIFMYVTP